MDEKDGFIIDFKVTFVSFENAFWETESFVPSERISSPPEDVNIFSPSEDILSIICWDSCL